VRVATPVKFNVPVDTDKSKDNFKVDPEIVPETVPIPVSVLMSAHAASSRIWTPEPLVDPEKEVPVCLRVMENEPPSLNVQPNDPGPDHVHVPVQVPARGVVGPMGNRVFATVRAVLRTAGSNGFAITGMVVICPIGALGLWTERVGETAGLKRTWRI
jgi:hypothetical protein